MKMKTILHRVKKKNNKLYHVVINNNFKTNKNKTKKFSFLIF